MKILLIESNKNYFWKDLFYENIDITKTKSLLCFVYPQKFKNSYLPFGVSILNIWFPCELL